MKTGRFKRGLVATFACAFALAVNASPPVFHATRIGVLPGSTNSVGTGVNFDGVVVGWATAGTAPPRAWRHSGTTLTDLRLGGIGHTALGINDRGEIVGFVLDSPTTSLAYRLIDNAIISLTAPGAANVAFAINASGHAALSYVTSAGIRPARYVQSVTDLGSFGGSEGAAYGINANGQLVGYSDNAAGNARAFLWANGSLQDLGTLGGPFSVAFAINVHGEIVGSSATAVVNQARAFLYYNGQMTDLGSLGGSNSSAQAINDASQIVGRATTALGASNGFLFHDGAMYDLNALVVSGLNGAHLTYGIAINNKSQIVAHACPTQTTCQTFRLDPVAPAGKVRAIVYYHAAFDHYFLTTIDDEVAKLDNGTFVGWTRTGESINVDAEAPAGTVPVCRFFSASFAPKSSHFYTPFAAECETVKQNPLWTFEGEVFRVALPDPTGACTNGRSPVYRLYNNGMGAAPNHAYTTSLNKRAALVAKGWIPEGLGDLGVIMCV